MEHFNTDMHYNKKCLKHIATHCLKQLSCWRFNHEYGTSCDYAPLSCDQYTGRVHIVNHEYGTSCDYAPLSCDQYTGRVHIVNHEYGTSCDYAPLSRDQYIGRVHIVCIFSAGCLTV